MANENDDCSTCSGSGEIEVSLPTTSEAQEPDIRHVSCPECNTAPAVEEERELFGDRPPERAFDFGGES